MKKLLCALATSLALLSTAPVYAFEFTFDWGNIPRCTSGSPGRVTNPTFNLQDVPAGTATIKFTLTDQNVPEFTHGGGAAPYTGNTVAPGAFKYLSPCPPNGSHTYVWNANALDASGKKLASARSKQQYP